MQQPLEPAGSLTIRTDRLDRGHHRGGDGGRIVLRIYTEEVNYRAEPLLAGALRRPTYMASNVLVALIGLAIAMLVAGMLLGAVVAAQDDAFSVSDVVRQSIVTIPAVWALVALVLAAVGAAPSRRVIGWIGIVATFGLTILGPTFNLPDWALDVSPLRHVPNILAPTVDWMGLLWIAGAIAVLLTVGFVGYRRRDII